MKVSILSGIHVDGESDVRTLLPRNLVPTPKASGVSDGYLAPSDGLAVFATGPGIDRGGINWNGACYRVMGTKLVRISVGGVVTVLGDVGAGGPVSLDYSFDRLAIASGGRLYYWDAVSLTQVTDPDLGQALDMLWIAGYFMTTDGVSLVVTELADPYAVDPLKYGSSETDPDPVVAIKKVRSEVVALNRYTCESFQNVGGDGFPFARIDGASIQRGCVGVKACCLFAESVAFLGSGRNEAPGIYLAVNGSSQKLSTREIDLILASYTEAQLAVSVLEARISDAHQFLYIHLPDLTLVFDSAASAAMSTPIWFALFSSLSGPGQYRARFHVWCYDRWLCGDPQSSNVGELVQNVSTHYGAEIGWEISTPILYNEARSGIVHQLELVGVPGGARIVGDPPVYTSYSLDGVNWTPELAKTVGSTGSTQKRITWRRLGHMQDRRIQKFRGTSAGHFPLLRLELQVEPLGV